LFVFKSFIIYKLLITANEIITGKLQTWSLIAHGIETNPNERVKDQDTSSKSGTGNKKTSPNDGGEFVRNASSKSPGDENDFDGSDNSIAVPLNHAINSQSSNSEMLSILSTSVASSPSSSSCAKISDHGACLGWCLLLLLTYLYFQELQAVIHIGLKSFLSQESKPPPSKIISSREHDNCKYNSTSINCIHISSNSDRINNYFLCIFLPMIQIVISNNKKNLGFWRNPSQLIQNR
jgi:hypothetical protein